MARSRIIKPEFFRSRSLSRVSIPARLTFIGLWADADSAGRGLAHPVILKGVIWPLDDEITPQDISDHLEELAGEHIRLYTVGEDTYYAVTSWEKHQSASYRTGESKFPAPEVVQVAQPPVQVARPAVHKEKGREGKRICAPTASESTSPPRNELWDALTRAFGEPATKSEKSNRGRQVKELAAVNATAADIDTRVLEHRRRNLNWTLTANALVTKWTELAPKAAADARVFDADTGAWLSPKAMR